MEKENIWSSEGVFSEDFFDEKIIDDHLVEVSEETFESPLKSSLERLNVLSCVLQKVENPIFALRSQDLAELLLDLGLMLQNQADSELDLGTSVKEDPLDRSDVRGNVQMFHHRESIVEDPEVFRQVGDCLMDLAHEVEQHHLHLLRVNEKIQIESPRWDDRAIDSVLDARQEISNLKRSLGRLVARNKVLAGKLTKYRHRVRGPLDIQFQTRKTSPVSREKGKHPSSSISCRGNEDSSKVLTRNEKRKDSFSDLLDKLSESW